MCEGSFSKLCLNSSNSVSAMFTFYFYPVNRSGLGGFRSLRGQGAHCDILCYRDDIELQGKGTGTRLCYFCMTLFPLYVLHLLKILLLLASGSSCQIFSQMLKNFYVFPDNVCCHCQIIIIQLIHFIEVVAVLRD